MFWNICYMKSLNGESTGSNNCENQLTSSENYNKLIIKGVNNVLVWLLLSNNKWKLTMDNGFENIFIYFNKCMLMP